MPAAPATQPPAALQGFPDVVAGILRRWQAPGLAVAVVVEGEVVLAQGFGVRDIASGLPVTPRTLFAIGSATKAFTTLGLGLLADEGKLDWDTPVKTYLPTFALRDPFAGERLTPRDLVTHRSGLPRHDLVWYGSPLSRSEMVERLRYLEPTQDFRATWQYQNLMYLVAGFLAGHVAGQEWEGFVQARIFDRLGMGASNFSVTASQAAADVASPYRETGGRVEAMAFRAIDAVGPAGSINSNVEDMAEWLLLHLNGGRHGEQRLISEGQLARMHAPQMVVPDPGRYAEVSLPSYGLGWFVRSYRGQTLVSHGGNIDGFSALVSFLPRQRIGVVALANLNGAPVPDIVAYHVYDRLLGLDEIPWDARFLQDRDEQREAEATGTAKRETDRVKGTHPSHPLDDYTGEFEHPAYGTLAVERAGEGLALRYNALVGPLRHHHYDSFEFAADLVERRLLLSFATDAQGRIAGLAAPLEPTVPDIVFTRRPSRETTETGFIERFVGTYAFRGMPLTVALKGPHALQVSLPGQARPRAGAGLRHDVPPQGPLGVRPRVPERRGRRRHRGRRRPARRGLHRHQDGRLRRLVQPDRAVRMLTALSRRLAVAAPKH